MATPKDRATDALSSVSSPSSISPDDARTLVGGISVALGTAALLAPGSTARAFGVAGTANPALPLLVRFIGIRNATMGAGLLQAETRSAQRLATQLGLAVGAADVVALLLAARTGVLSRRSAVVGLVVLGGIAGLGYAALQD